MIRDGIRRIRVLAAIALVSALCGGQADASDVGARGAEVLGWQTSSVARVVSFTQYGSPGRVTEIAGRKCISGYQFFFDVLDHLAFDIDEDVELRIELDTQTSSSRARVQYDANGAVFPLIQVALPEASGTRFQVIRLPLRRARFAGRGEFGADIRIAADNGAPIDTRIGTPTITLCDVSIERSHTTPRPAAYGWLDLRVLDERNEPTPARISILDASGRMPLPDPAAIEIKEFSHRTRSVRLSEGTVNWPLENRFAFYVDGKYRARLPVGTYRLLVTKGIEYRYARASFEVKPDRQSEVSVALDRWIDMRSRGWTSGDVHVHAPRRDESESHEVLLQAQAEDVNVTNTLQMGNIANTYFPQRFWRGQSAYGNDRYALVAGQEDPRSAVRGHTVQLNLSAAVRQPESYLSYHSVAASVAAQGGVSGYAHLDRLGSRVGLGMDVPLGHVAFLEVLQRGELSMQPWFDFLNLGYKLAPAAGSDYPYGAQVGDVRTYARAGAAGGPQSWFDALARGETFVTNGPIIEFSVNGRSMGQTVDATANALLRMRVEARINPDIDRLDRIELIEQGAVIATVSSEQGSEMLELVHQQAASHGTWFVVRAFGKISGKPMGNVVAISAPIYVSVDGSRTWKADVAPQIARQLETELDEFSRSALSDHGRLDEWFETESVWRQRWAAQQSELREHIERAKAALKRWLDEAS